VSSLTQNAPLVLPYHKIDPKATPYDINYGDNLIVRGP
jgi:hypothetical protein